MHRVHRGPEVGAPVGVGGAGGGFEEVVDDVDQDLGVFAQIVYDGTRRRSLSGVIRCSRCTRAL